MELPSRKSYRLKQYDYSAGGAYFITVCTESRKEILSKIYVGTGVLDCPKSILLPHGLIADKQIKTMQNFYDTISVSKYVIMPNHIHFLLAVSGERSGQSRTPVPTRANATVSSFISTFKRFCNREYGENIWQSRFYDHIIRGEQDYNEIWQYIDNNPAKWKEDRFYTK